MLVRIDPIACDARGLCAELAPELFAIDDWGYAMLLVNPIPDELATLARRAADACPTLALHIE
jgi:ferredoxin